jgi:predicted RNA-binding Zn-ribbon protein involved in translation (DUF1610 family)
MAVQFLCPGCDARIDLEEATSEDGSTFDCPECGVSIDIVYAEESAEQAAA